MKLSIALAQINTHLGDVHANLEKHISLIKDARAAGSDLLVFPETFANWICTPRSRANSCSSPKPKRFYLPTIAQSQPGYRSGGGVRGRGSTTPILYASAYISQGEILHVHRKVYLPTYGLFDEGRFFAWGDAVQSFDTRFGRIGILICEDFWHASPPYLLWLDGADMFLFSSASPGRGLNSEPQLESARWVEHINQAYASLFTIFVAHANRVGFEDGLNFWGGDQRYSILMVS